MAQPTNRKDKVRVYISYRQSDASELAGWLEEQLREQGVDPWLDRTALLPGENWRQAIDHAITDSDAVLAVLSREGSTSQGVLHDHEMARSLGKPCFPILAHPDAPVPSYFRDVLWVDLSNPENRTQRFKRLLDQILRIAQSKAEPPASPEPESIPVPAALALAYRVVLARQVSPDMLRNLEVFPWAAVLQNRNMSELEHSLPEKAPQPLWEAWIRATKPRAVAALEKALGAVTQSKRVPS
jgi:hypothetical protein